MTEWFPMGFPRLLKTTPTTHRLQGLMVIGEMDAAVQKHPPETCWIVTSCRQGDQIVDLSSTFSPATTSAVCTELPERKCSARTGSASAATIAIKNVARRQCDDRSIDPLVGLVAPV